MTEAMTNQQILLFIFTAVISSSALTSLINHFVNRSQNKTKEALDVANRNKVNAEAEQIETDTEARLIEYQDKQINKLLCKLKEFQLQLEEYEVNYNKALSKLQEVSTELEDNKKQMDAVLKILKAKDKEVCKRKDCPTRV